MNRNGTLHNRLPVLRAEKRWSQQELAEKLGVTRQTIISIEANRYNPSLILAFEIAHLFGVSLEHVFEYHIQEVSS